MPKQLDLANDPFFHLTGETTWNACIGPQGHEENYVDGYMEAALYLAQAVLEKELLISRDTLVLPILYNARHAIELTLKFVMRRLHEAGLLNAAPRANHVIQDHLDHLKEGKIGDFQLRETIDRLSPFVLSLAAIDNDGQQLRYATTQEGQQSLDKRPLANLRVIHTSLQELSQVLRSLKNRTQSLCEEHATTTCTPKCSRSDLMAIAIELAEEQAKHGASYKRLSSWKPLREKIKARYELGNKTLDDAISVLEAHPEMGSLLGKEFHLKCLTDEKIRFIAACWTRQHPPRSPGEPRTRIWRSSDLRDAMHRAAETFNVVDDLLEGLTRDDLVDLHTVFYLARDKYFCESYEQLFEQHSREFAAADEILENARHILSKTNLLRELEKGLRMLGRRNMAAEILACRPDLFQ